MHSSLENSAILQTLTPMSTPDKSSNVHYITGKFNGRTMSWLQEEEGVMTEISK